MSKQLLDNINEIQRQKNAYITPGNIKDGVTIFNVTGTEIPLSGETIDITPTTSQQVITPSAGKNGITQATVSPVTSSIDANIVQENIRSGVTILGVEGTYKGETSLNIYTQTIEPTNKNGLWLKTNTINSPAIIEDDVVLNLNTWDTEKMNNMSSIPYSFLRGAAVSIGTDVYLFGGFGGYTTAYKHNTLTDTYTQLTDVPFSIYDTLCTSVGTDIYLFSTGNSSYMNVAYKYDTLTDTYTRLANVYFCYGGSAVSVGTDIYIFGGSRDHSYYRRTTKYNTLTNEYSSITGLPFDFYQGAAVSIGTDVYLFGGSGATAAYKYNTLTDTYTQLTDVPFNFSMGAGCSVSTNIYLFGGSLNKRKAYKYNTLTDVYTILPNIPYDFSDGSCCFVDQYVYLYKDTKVMPFIVGIKTYPDNSIVISNSDDIYETKIITDSVTNGLSYHFYDFWYATTSEGITTFDITTPTYYGNGTEWLGIRNPDVLSVELNDNEMTVEMGGTETLIATVKPTNATIKTVTWSSSDDTIATVSDGTITPVAEGTCIITVTTTDGGFTDTCEVTVIEASE